MDSVGSAKGVIAFAFGGERRGRDEVGEEIVVTVIVDREELVLAIHFLHENDG